MVARSERLEYGGTSAIRYPDGWHIAEEAAFTRFNSVFVTLVLRR
jgi:hypothetical protein